MVLIPAQSENFAQVFLSLLLVGDFHILISRQTLAMKLAGSRRRLVVGAEATIHAYSIKPQCTTWAAWVATGSLDWLQAVETQIRAPPEFRDPPGGSVIFPMNWRFGRVWA